MKFQLTKDCYEKNEVIFNSDEVDLEPGLTVLVGCNGYGKSTWMKQIKNQLKPNKQYLTFDYATSDTSYNKMDKFLVNGDLTKMATMATSSEGERLFIGFADFVQQFRRFIEKNKNRKDLFIFADGIDSGLSIDKLEYLKEFFHIVLDDNPDVNLYIIVSTNSYELAKDERCLDVVNNDIKTFKTYKEFRNFVIESSKTVNGRY